MTTTPALARAYGAADSAMTTVTPPPRVDIATWLDEHGRRALIHGAAHAAVSAALHDPADPDFGPKVLFRFDYDEEKWGDWSVQFLTVQSVYRERYANLVAAIFGGA